MIDQQRPSGPGTGRGYGAAAAVFAVGMAGTTLPTPLYGLYREKIGFSELMVTIVFAVYAVGVIGVLLLVGNYSDRVGRRPVLYVALGLSAGSALCFLFEGGLPLLFAGRLLSGFSAGLFSGAATAAVMELAPPHRAARAGLAATAANMGGLGCGPLLAGLLAEYAPWPLRLPFLVHLVLVAASCVVVLLLPETAEGVAKRRPGGEEGAAVSADRDPGAEQAEDSGPGAGRAGDRAGGRDRQAVRTRTGIRDWPRPRPQGLVVPVEVRGVFTASALAAFAGFSLLGLFTAVAPSFVAETLDVHNLAVSGALVFCVFLSSTLGQSLMGAVGARRSLPVGCLVLVVGLILVGGSLVVEALPLLVAGAVCGGLGQGLAFRAGITAVSRAAPATHRAGTISAFFVVAYGGISLPVVGVGALAVSLGLRPAGIVFASCVVVLAAAVGLYVQRHPAPDE